MITIQVLGTGCSRCRTLAINAERAVREACIDAEVVKVSEIPDLLAFEGLRGFPALAIDGQVKAFGRTLSPDEIKPPLSPLSQGHPDNDPRESGMSNQIIDAVRTKYGSVAKSGLSGDEAGVRAVAAAFGYSDEELGSIPAEANMGLSCGNPTATASLKPGEVVVDLGSGGGLDVFLAARRVGPSGRAIGIDMTQEMIDLAESNASKARDADGQPLRNVEFHRATIDAMPLADASVDCVISNCVLNLVPDKATAFREIARVLKPGGRLAASDIALKQPLPAELTSDLMAYVGCIAGAIPIDDYRSALKEAGFAHVEIIDSQADLNAYAKIENQAGCCSPSESAPGPATGGAASCCAPAPGSNTPELLERLAELVRRYDINRYAASVKVFAVKP